MVRGGHIPVGPIEPATNRGRSAVLYSSAAARASWAAAILISSVRAPGHSPLG